jgi:transposase
MIVRKLKLKLTKTQDRQLNTWLWHLTSVYNWTIKKIENDARDRIYHSKFDLYELLNGHSQKLEIPAIVIRGTILQGYESWQRCFRKIGRKPHLKGRRNPLSSIPFPRVITSPKDNRIGLPGLGKVRYHKQEIPTSKIKQARILKRSSGWYLCLWLDTDHKFEVKDTNKVVGIDPGFHTLLTLSDGIKIENPRELRKGAKRLSQAQRGNRKQLAARLQERQANRRNDRNHKISRWLVENYHTIFYSDDNFKSMAKRLGKSVSEAALGDLINKLIYKGKNCGRLVRGTKSNKTTMTCSNCGSLTGPTGWNGLAVRNWVCSACGVDHDRDLNSAMVVLSSGLGMSLSTEIS